MPRHSHPMEKPIETINYRGAEFEIVERPDVLWVGCVDYASNFTDESDIGATLKRYREELIHVPKLELIHPDWSAALSINYTRSDRPCGIMFAQETSTDKQDPRYELYTQPGGLWIKVRNDSAAALALMGKERAEPYEYFGILRKAADANGYTSNTGVDVEVEYHCHAEYGTPPHTNYAYVAVLKA